MTGHATDRTPSGFGPSHSIRTLFRKQVRSLSVPATMFFLLVHMPIWTGLILLNFWYSDYYSQTVLAHLDDRTLMNTFVWHPFIQGDAIAFMYTALLIYALIHEQLHHTRIQLDMLPVRRMTQLAVIYAAFTFWVVLFYTGIALLTKVMFTVRVINTSIPAVPYLGLLIQHIGHACETLAIASVGMIGFVVTAIIPRRWWRYIAVVAIGLAGYLVIPGYVALFREHITRWIPSFELPGGEMAVYFSPGYEILPYISIAALFIIASMFLYERFSEV